MFAFVKHGADVNAKDSMGNTALHCAVAEGHERCVWALLDACGDEVEIDAENAAGQTPLLQGYLMLWTRSHAWHYCLKPKC